MRLSRALIPLVAASLALTACGGSNDKKADTSSPQKVAAGASLNSTWPLTGLSVTGDGSAAQSHPVYIAKIDNTPDSNPQYGLSKADMVVEELVEGNITRLAAFFYSHLPTKVGPIRSMRASDVGIASPVGARLITSGAAPYTYKALKKAGVRWIDMNDRHVKRVLDGTHDTLHSVEADIAAIGAGAKRTPTRPKDYFPWGSQAHFAGTKAARTVQASFGGRVSTWHFAGGKYHLQNGACSICGNYMDKGDQFEPDTVVAAQVKTTIAPYKDPAGNPVPVSHFNGQGKAWIFHGGKMVRATWKKKSENSAIGFTLPGGKKLTIPAGHVWLELIPKNGGSVTFTKR